MVYPNGEIAWGKVRFEVFSPALAPNVQSKTDGVYAHFKVRTLLPERRVERAGYVLEHTNVECLGTGACVPQVIEAGAEPPEVVLRVTVRDTRRGAVDRFAKELAPLVTSGPPGITGYTTGRPPVREVFAYWPALILKSAVEPVVLGP